MNERSDIQELWDGGLNEEVSSRFNRIREHIGNQSVHICTNCGGEMLLSQGCLSCPVCGEKSCGDD